MHFAKRLAVILLVATAVSLLFGAGPAEAAGIKIYVYGELIPQDAYDAPPYIDENGRVMVPLRLVSEAMYAKVDWDARQQLVTIVKGSTTVKLRIGQSVALVNGKEKRFDTRAVIRNGRTMVPLRFVSETLGEPVEWRASERAVYVKVIPQPGLPPLAKLPILSEQDLDRMGLAKLPYWRDTTPWPGFRPCILRWRPGQSKVLLVYLGPYNDKGEPVDPVNPQIHRREVQLSGPYALTEVKGTYDGVELGGPYVLARGMEAVFGPDWVKSAHWDPKNKVLTIRGSGRHEVSGWPIRYVQIGLERVDGKYSAEVKYVYDMPYGTDSGVAKGSYMMKDGQIVTYNIYDIPILIGYLNGAESGRYDSMAGKEGYAGAGI